MKKLFVIDTNVVLFDHTCIYNFQEHDVALSAVVLEELDRFKRGNDLINLEARQFIRELDGLFGKGPLKEGLPLGEERGRLFVETGEPTCHLFGFGMLYLPRALIAGFVEEFRTGLDAGLVSFGDTAFAGWHHRTVRAETPIAWDVRPIHLHYSTAGLVL